MDEILNTLGANIKSLRKKRKMTLLDLEVKSGLSDTNISQIERGNVNITFTKLVKIAEALEVELNDLYHIKK